MLHLNRRRPKMSATLAKLENPAREKTIPPTRILLIGYGNPGRQDDGLGAACIETLTQRLAQKVEDRVSIHDLSNIELNTQVVYQLSVEEALDVSENDCVVFIDASLNGADSFEFLEISSSVGACFGSHSLNPQGVLELCDSLYRKQPDGYVLAIRGYEFDQFQEALSNKARDNLYQATDFLLHWLNEQATQANTRTKDDA